MVTCMSREEDTCTCSMSSLVWAYVLSEDINTRIRVACPSKKRESGESWDVRRASSRRGSRASSSSGPLAPPLSAPSLSSALPLK